MDSNSNQSQSKMRQNYQKVY